jgi:hypothetical protein
MGESDSQEGGITAQIGNTGNATANIMWQAIVKYMQENPEVVQAVLSQLLSFGVTALMGWLATQTKKQQQPT